MGRARQYTPEEIAEIRDLYRRWKAVRTERTRYTKSKGMRPHHFNRIGRKVQA